MSAIEDLRRMLDEQGMGSYTHEAPAAVCLAFFDGKRWHDCWESTGGEVNVTFSMTPEQAIAAALGLRTCQAAETDRYRVRTEDTGCPLTVHVMECGECGGTYGYVTGGYEYCPRCGRKVVVE